MKDWKYYVAKIWMGIVYTSLGAGLLTLMGLLVWVCIIDPAVAAPFILFGCFASVYLVFFGLFALTKWAQKTIDKGSAEKFGGK